MPIRLVHRLAVPALLISAGVAFAQDGITLETDDLRIRIGRDAAVASVFDKPAGRELVEQGGVFCWATVGERDYPARRMQVREGELVFTFGPIALEIRIAFAQNAERMLFTLAGVSGEAVQSVRIVDLVMRRADRLLAQRFLAYDGTQIGLIPATPEAFVRAYNDQRAVLRGAAWTDLPRPVGAQPMLGTRVALFAAPFARFADRISSIERELGIPVGIAGKARAENRHSYLMVNGVTAENGPRLVGYAKAGGFGGVLFFCESWADWNRRYAPPADRYPGGIDQLRSLTGSLEAAGISPGAHVFTTTTTTESVTRSRLSVDGLLASGTQTLARSVSAEGDFLETTEIPRAWTERPNQRDVRVGDEIISFERLQSTSPFGLVGCRRGQRGTQAAPHAAGTELRQLQIEDPIVGYWLDPAGPLWQSHAQDIAAAYEAAGFRWIYFDGTECVPAPMWYTFPWGHLPVLRHLKREPVIVESAGIEGYSWHLTTRSGQTDYYRKSPDPRTEIDLRISEGVAYARNMLMAAQIGWFPTRVWKQNARFATPDEFEYLYVKALGADAAVAVQSSMEDLDKLPQRDAILANIARLEELRLAGYFDDATRAALLAPRQDFMLVQDRRGRYYLPRSRPISVEAGSEGQLRAILSEPFADGFVVVSLWNIADPVELELSAAAAKIEVIDFRGGPLELQAGSNGARRLRVSTRVYLRFPAAEPDETGKMLREIRVRAAS